MENYGLFSKEELINEINALKAAMAVMPVSDSTQTALASLQKNMLKTVMDAGTSTFWEYDVERDFIHMGLGYIDDPSQSVALPKYIKTPLVNLKTFLATIHPEDVDRILNEHVLPMLSGKIEKTTITFRRLFDEKVTWLVSSMRISEYKEDGTASKVVCYSQDITEQIEMNTHLTHVENENKLFEYAVNFSNDEVHALDANGRFVFMNRLMMNNFGFKPPISNYTLADIDNEYSIERWINETAPAVREGRLTQFDAKHDYPDGSVRRIEVQLYKIDDPQRGEIFWAFCRDIEERLKQHRQISRLNSMMNALLDNSPIGFIAQDANNEARYLYFNKMAEQITGFKSSQMVGRTDAEAFANNPRAFELMQFYQRRLLENKHVANYGVELMTKGGTVHYIINENHQHVEIPENGISLFLYIFWDVTEQHEKELELIRAKEADKLKSAFLANMSHEIRTPLNSIVGFSNLLAESNDLEEKEMFTQIISKNNDLLLQLINDILDFSKIESGQLQYNLQQVDVKDICFEVYQNFSLKSKPGVDVVYEHDTHVSAVVVADYNRLSQVIINLMSNALKFTDEGVIVLSYVVTKSNVTISVKDTGIGVPLEKQSSLFNRFVKLNEFKQGTGLGLAISKMIVEALKGDIGFNSVEGEGSTFWVKLPLIRR